MAIKDKLRKINPLYVTLLLFVVPVALVAAFVYFIYMPYNGKKAELQAAIEKNESEISKSQIMERRLGELKAATQRLNTELKTATERLPSGAEEAALPDTITSLVKDSGLNFKSLKKGDKRQGPGGLYFQTPITVELTGGYHKVGKLMESIDKMTRELTVSDLSMSSAKVEGKEMSIAVSFTITAFSAAGGK